MVPAIVHCMYLMQSCQKARHLPPFRNEGHQGEKEIAGKQFTPLKLDPCRTRSGAAGFAAISAQEMKLPLSARSVRLKKTVLKDLCNIIARAYHWIELIYFHDTNFPGFWIYTVE